MDKLHRQALALVETCRSMTKIPKKFRPPVDISTIEATAELLNAAREQNPDDVPLAELNAAEAGFSWWSLSYLIASISRSLDTRSTNRRKAKR
jgi:hypothetical protein